MVGEVWSEALPRVADALGTDGKEGDMFYPSLVLAAAGGAGDKDESVAMATVGGLVARFVNLHRGVPEGAREEVASGILRGDVMLARVFALLAAHPRCGGLPLVSRAIATMAEGAVVDLMARFTPRQTETDYVARVGRLSADFTATCCQLGGRVARTHPVSLSALWRAGYALGLARAAAQEVRSWVTWIKGSGAVPYLGEGVLGLPEIYVLQDRRHGPLLATALQSRRFAESDLQTVAHWLMDGGGFKHTQCFIRRQLLQARRALTKAASVHCQVAGFLRGDLLNP